ncbi:hypothetical protein AAZX31_08G263200, partial [Glycine max]
IQLYLIFFLVYSNISHLFDCCQPFFGYQTNLPKGNFNVADFPSFAISFTTAPVALANCPPFPSVISMLCMVVPKGVLVEVDSFFFINQNLFPNCTSFLQSVQVFGC